jgi:hypothetical protein
MLSSSKCRGVQARCWDMILLIKGRRILIVFREEL